VATRCSRTPDGAPVSGAGHPLVKQPVLLGELRELVRRRGPRAPDSSRRWTAAVSRRATLGSTAGLSGPFTVTTCARGRKVRTAGRGGVRFDTVFRHCEKPHAAHVAHARPERASRGFASFRTPGENMPDSDRVTTHRRPQWPMSHRIGPWTPPFRRKGLLTGADGIQNVIWSAPPPRAGAGGFLAHRFRAPRRTRTDTCRTHAAVCSPPA
jgi:hypothetical protein